MEKKLVVVLGLLVVAVIGGAVFIWPSKQTNKSTTAQQEQLNPVAKVDDGKDACKLFTLDEAKKVFSGHDIAQVDSLQDFQSSDTTTSDCGYAVNTPDLSKAINVYVVIQTSNKQIAKNNFMSTKTKTAQDIQSVGQEAYWDPDMLKLSVLNNDKWISVSVNGTVLKDKELHYAKQVISNL